MKPYQSVVGVTFGVLLLTYAGLHWWEERNQIKVLQVKLEKKEKALLGYTQYTSFLTLGNQALVEQQKLLAANVSRQEGVTQIIQQDLIPGIKSTGIVTIWYDAEYSFGYDLRPNQYELRATSQGLEIKVAKPVLVATPAVTNLHHNVISRGVLVNENLAVIRLQQQAAEESKKRGQSMANGPEIVALCEKQLIEFVRSFLLKQPGVSAIPYITVVYK